MLATIGTRAVRDRATGVAIGAGVTALFLLFGLAVYRDIDLSVYTDLPEAVRDVMGIPDGADAAVLAFNVMFGTLGALTLAGIAISIGAGAIAGEERAGTMGLLLANPTPRSRVLLAKAAALVALVAAAGLGLWAAGHLAPAVLDVDTGEMHIGAMVLHLSVNALFYGFLALGIGAATGNRTLASGAAAAVMAVSFVAVGLLPTVDAIASGVKALPWYYFDGSQPLVNGVGWGHLGVLAGGIVAFAAIGAKGFDRRDLTRGDTSGSLADRLRAHAVTRRLVGRMTGPARVSRPWTKLAAEHQGLLAVVAGVMFSTMGVLMGVMYTLIDDSLADLGNDLPDALLSIVGAGDTSTPEGWLQLETFGLMVPVAIIGMAMRVAVRGTVGEEQRGTMSLLLANPISRRRVVLEATLAMTLYAGVVGAAVFTGTALGSIIAGLGVSIANLAAASLLGTLLGLAYGALALALGGITGRARIAIYGTIGAAASMQLLNGFLTANEDLAGWARLTPFHYYLGGDPLNAGLDIVHAGVLAGLAALLVLVAVVAFDRRDLRRG